MAELTDNERQLLAREIAADKRVGGGGYYNDNMREVFVSGWNAAMEYVEVQQRRQRQPQTGEDDQT